jgi:predicted RNA-binding Zn ribbon-like protein
MIHATVSAGVSPFSFRSDRIALDFAATRMFRGSARERELLTTTRALSEWAHACGLLSGVPDADSAADVLDQAIAIREAIYAAATAVARGAEPPRAHVATLNRHAGRPPVTVTLARDGTLRRSGSLAQVLASIARDAVELLGGEDSSRVRQCARAGCTRLFLDRTRGQTRVWCGMSACGNRVNAAAYRRRRGARGVSEIR